MYSANGVSGHAPPGAVTVADALSLKRCDLFVERGEVRFVLRQPRLRVLLVDLNAAQGRPELVLTLLVGGDLWERQVAAGSSKVGSQHRSINHDYTPKRTLLHALQLDL